MVGLFEQMRCTAKSKRTGLQCGRGAVPGATVCRHHGGYAPQVRLAAAERLASLVHPAIDGLTKLLKSQSDSVKLLTAKDILDRSGHKAPERHEVTGPDGGPLTVELVVRFPEGEP